MATHPIAGIYPFDIGAQSSSQMHVNQPKLGQNYPYQTQAPMDVNGEMFSGIPVGSGANMRDGASTMFGTAPSYNSYQGQLQSGFMPFSIPQGAQMGSNQAQSY